MSHQIVPSPSPARGHRVRELVCVYRPLRDSEGRLVDVPTLALSTPRVAAAILGPLLAGEPVENFGVACLSTRHRLLAWHIVARGTRTSAPVSMPDVFVPACLTPGTTGLIVLHNQSSRAGLRLAPSKTRSMSSLPPSKTSRQGDAMRSIVTSDPSLPREKRRS